MPTVRPKLPTSLGVLSGSFATAGGTEVPRAFQHPFATEQGSIATVYSGDRQGVGRSRRGHLDPAVPARLGDVGGARIPPVVGHDGPQGRGGGRQHGRVQRADSPSR